MLKVGLAHAGEFGGIEATQRAKSEMVTDLPADAVAVLNADDPRVAIMAEQTAARVVFFGLSAGCRRAREDLHATATGTGSPSPSTASATTCGCASSASTT